MRPVLTATALATALLAATPSFALNLSGSYEATFSVANGNQKPVCFLLASTGAQKSYRDQGAVTSPDYPNYTGDYVVYKNAFHLTFLNTGRPSVTITGNVSGRLLKNTSATEFAADGTILNVGTLTTTKSCTGQ